MTKLLEFRLETGGSVLVEVDEQTSGPALAATPGEIASQAKITFEQATAKLRPIAKAIIDQVTDLGPNEVKIELGIKFSAEAGIVLARSSVEGSCKLTLSWKRSSGSN